MKSKASSIIKGVGIGMAVGGATAMIGSTMMGKPSKRITKKNTAKAMRTVGQIIDNIQYMMK